MKGRNPNKSFLEQLDRVPKVVKSFNRLSMGLAASIEDAFKAKGLNQKRFAELCGKKESEISKWLSGTHNFTINTIAFIEAKLDTQLLACCGDFDLPFISLDEDYQEELRLSVRSDVVLSIPSISQEHTYDLNTLRSPHEMLLRTQESSLSNPALS